MSAPATRPARSPGSPPAPPGPGPAIPANLRQAALLLHGLPGADREWLLEQLPEAERAPLRTLVAELAALGIPTDRGLVEEVIGGGGATAPAGAADRALANADPALLAEILRQEPAGLVAALLESGDWPWRGQLLEALGTAHRRDAEDELARCRARRSAASGPGRGVALALRERLVAALAARLQEVAGEPAAEPGSRGPRPRRRGAASGWCRRAWLARLFAFNERTGA